MSTNGSHRRHSPQFKLQLYHDIRDGRIDRREAQRTYRISANLIQMWLSQFDHGKLDGEEIAVSTIAEYEAKIAALERKAGQLIMEVGLLKKTSRLLLVGSNENSSIISGLFIALSARGTTWSHCPAVHTTIAPRPKLSSSATTVWWDSLARFKMGFPDMIIDVLSRSYTHADITSITNGSLGSCGSTI